ncbi:MAG: signal peptidase II [Proteobacteria bacterium]|nr:signal peptidase II [Pseudomonadota bacterium]
MKKKILNYLPMLWPLLLALGVVVLDQWSKVQILHLFSTPRGMVTVTPFFNLVLVLNRGVSFGIFDGTTVMSDFFAGLGLVITLVLILWLPRLKTRLSALAFGLLIGGAIGNVTDRLRLGAVVDFLDFHVANLHWPAFNVADSAVVTGVAALLLQSLVFDKKTRHSF